MKIIPLAHLLVISNEFYLSQSTLERYHSHNRMLICFLLVLSLFLYVFVYVCGFTDRHQMGLSLLWPRRGVIVKLCHDPSTN